MTNIEQCNLILSRMRMSGHDVAETAVGWSMQEVIYFLDNYTKYYIDEWKQPTLREYYRPKFGTKVFDLADGLISYDELMNLAVPDSEKPMDAELLEDEQHMTDWLNDLVSSVSK
jgi:hypothetical protein